MTFDYNAFKTDTLTAVKGIGQALQSRSQAERDMTPAQVKKVRGKSLMIDEIWQYRRLAGGALVAEISYTWFLSRPLLGLTVFCTGELASDASEWDHALSGCFNTIEDLAGRLAMLERGGRDRIAALVAEA
jgi:hypothetical protein